LPRKLNPAIFCSLEKTTAPSAILIVVTFELPMVATTDPAPGPAVTSPVSWVIPPPPPPPPPPPASIASAIASSPWSTY